MQEELEKIIREEFSNRFGNVSDNIEVGSNSNYTYGTFRKVCIEILSKILSTGYVKLSEMKCDEEKIADILQLWRDKGAIKYTGNVAHAIATQIKDLIYFEKR